MFQLTLEEYESLTSKGSYGGRRYYPYAFTENAVAMLSSVLNSPQAIQVNIAIMRIFTKLRSFFMLEESLSNRMNKLELGTNKMFKIVFERLDNLEEEEGPNIPTKRTKIGLK